MSVGRLSARTSPGSESGTVLVFGIWAADLDLQLVAEKDKVALLP